MALVAGYIIYLGINILRAYARGEEGLPGWAAILFGVLFIVSGIAYLIFLFMQFRKLKASEGEKTADPEETAEETAIEQEETAEKTAIEQEETAEEMAIEQEETAGETAIEQEETAGETALEQAETTQEAALEKKEILTTNESDGP